MPNWISRLPLDARRKPMADRYAVLQHIIDEILRDLGKDVATEQGQKLVSAKYSTNRRHWYLEPADESDDSLCKQVLAEIARRVQAERPAPESSRPDAPVAGAD